MSSNNGRRAWGGQGRQSNEQAASQDQLEAAPTGMTDNGGDMKQVTQVSPSAAAPPTNTNARKPKGKKWAKLELVDIAPLAGPSYPPVQQNRKLQPPFGPRHHEGPHRGVNVDGKSLGEIADRLARLELEKANKPLTDFTQFPKIAPEIRFKIWKFAALGEARILELILHPDFILPASRTTEAIAEDPVDQNDLTSLNHRIYQVSKPGQKVPGVMQANSKSRREGMLVFEKRYINNHPRAYPYAENDERPWTWYNPYKDIIFFGEDTCIRTAVDFFRYNSNAKYAKAAFRCANIVEGYGIGGGGVGIMQVLHGVDEAIALNNLVPGAPAVEEVFFVVKTERMKFEAGAMPSNLTFRPSIHNGLTTSQEKMKTSYQKMINRDRSGERFDGFGEYRSVNGNYPDFNFVSLAPPLKDGKGQSLKHDAIMVPTKDIGKLIYRDSKFLYDLGHNTRVDIIPGRKAYTGEKYRETCLYNGTEEGIEKAKEEIKKQLLVDFETIRHGPNDQGTRRGGRVNGGHG